MLLHVFSHNAKFISEIWIIDAYYLCRHRFGICAGYFDARMQTSSIVSFNDIPAVNLVGAYSAVIGTCNVLISMIYIFLRELYPTF